MMFTKIQNKEVGTMKKIKRAREIQAEIQKFGLKHDDEHQHEEEHKLQALFLDAVLSDSEHVKALAKICKEVEGMCFSRWCT